MPAKIESKEIEREIIIATLMGPHGSTGVQTHIHALRAVLARSHVNVCIITPFSITKALVYPLFGVRKIIDVLSKTASLWWYRYWHYRCLKMALRRSMKAGGRTVVYAQCPLSAKAALESRTDAWQKVVMVVHYNVSQADEWVGKRYLRAHSCLYNSIQSTERDILPRLDGIVYVSEYMKGVIQSKVPSVVRVPSVVIPNFIFAPVRGVHGKIVDDMISIGTLEARKNQGYLLKVLAEANSLGKRYSLTIVGDGPDRATLENLAKSLGVDDQVRFMGYQPNAAKRLCAYRVYVHSALMENLPLSIIEAMACGLPLLAAAVGGIPEIFEDGREGYYWALDDPKGGAKRLISILEDSALYDDMKHACVQRFAERYDATVSGERLLSFLCAY
jgi:glycosyltransferase involved in cell wall biosynthesis